MSQVLSTEKCYKTTNGEYLGKYIYTYSFSENVGTQQAIASKFERGDSFESNFKEVPCKSVGLPNVDPDYVVDENGKHKCPICKAVEGGTQRIITHRFDCANKKGGRKNRKPTKKNRHRRRNRRSSRKNRIN
jgi:5-methylcytosine-specific restriction endonuclease McrA